MKNKLLIASVIILFAALLYAVIFGMQSEARQIRQQLRLGYKYLEEGNYEEAILAFEQIIAVEPRNVDARVGLGKSYSALERFDTAEAVLLEAVGIAPNRPEPYLELADIFIGIGRIKDAVDILEEGYAATGNEAIKAKLEEILSTSGGTAQDQGLVNLDIASLLGRSLSEIESILGEADEVSEHWYSGHFYEVFYEGMQIVFITWELGPSAVVRSIRTWNKELDIANGVKIGDPASMVIELLGDPYSEFFDDEYSQSWIKYYDDGIIFMYLYFETREGFLRSVWIKPGERL